MAETENIAKLAEDISQDIFKWLKWEQSSHFNVNYDCVLKEEHNDRKTHPTDTVFNYLDPYTGKRVYIQTDLKSYASKSITKTSTEKALISLSQSIQCSNLSSEWQTKFLDDDSEIFEVIGMLFIYNHDGEYDKDFFDLLQKINNERLNITKGQKIIVLDPSMIHYLHNIISDMKRLYADAKLPDIDNITYFYPDMVRTKRQDGDEWDRPATIEYITSRWLILKHKKSREQPEGYLIYYKNAGETIEEFVYLIDTLSNYQLLSEENNIKVRIFESNEEALNNFDKAKKQYIKSWGFDSNKKRSLEYISVERINTVTNTHNFMDIGMRL